ncbi:MAG: hypothetical protein QG564_1837 [Campylobacterota bacterium]|nr:hypothetical protein [Campylobacterota bacterium]
MYTLKTILTKQEYGNDITVYSFKIKEDDLIYEIMIDWSGGIDYEIIVNNEREAFFSEYEKFANISDYFLMEI